MNPPTEIEHWVEVGSASRFVWVALIQYFALTAGSDALLKRRSGRGAGIRCGA